MAVGYLVDDYVGPQRDLGVAVGCKALALKTWGETAASAVQFNRPDHELTNQVRWTRAALRCWLAQQQPPSPDFSERGTCASSTDDATPSSSSSSPVAPWSRANWGVGLRRWLQYINDL